MTERISNDASESIKAIVHQFYVALEKCFELEENESVYIEYYGDVSIEGKEQIEVKKYKKSLTNLDHNFWNTLRNWLNDKFPQEKFRNLILCTTQTISCQCKFNNWNKKDASEKYQILLDIYNDFLKKKTKDQQTIELLSFVMDSSRSKKLKLILTKLIIQSSYNLNSGLQKRIRDKHAKLIPQSSKDKFINSLLGYIISPEISNKNNWEISFNDFSEEAKEIAKVLQDNSVIFPPKIRLNNLNTDEYINSPFVKKIEDINYTEVIPDAINDYVQTNMTTKNEFKGSRYKYLQEYKDGINEDYRANYRIAKRNAIQGNIINCSQNFYDSFLSKTPSTFYTYNYVEPYFRRGLIHNMANSTTDYEIKWDLKDE